MNKYVISAKGVKLAENSSFTYDKTEVRFLIARSKDSINRAEEDITKALRVIKLSKKIIKSERRMLIRLKSDLGRLNEQI